MLIHLIIIQFVVFSVGLIFVLRKLFYRQLSSATARLKHLHEENIAREEELKKEFEAIRLQRQQELEKAQKEAQELLKTAKQKAEKLSAGIELQAKQQAQELFEKTRLALEKMEHDLAVGYKERSISLALDMIKALFSEQNEQTLQRQLIMELIEEIKNIKVDSLPAKTKEAKVISALPLTTDEKEKLAQALSSKVGTAVVLADSCDKELIAGLVIQMGPVKIDGSLRNKLRKITPHLRG